MRFLYAAFVLLLSACAAQAVPVWISPALRQPVRIYPPKFVISGGHVIVWTAYAVNPDCSSAGDVKFHIVREPAHGRLHVVHARVFPNFPRRNIRHVCDRRRVAGEELIFTARAGYRGADLVQFETISPAGLAFFVHMPIVVR